MRSTNGLSPFYAILLVDAASAFVRFTCQTSTSPSHIKKRIPNSAPLNPSIPATDRVKTLRAIIYDCDGQEEENIVYSSSGTLLCEYPLEYLPPAEDTSADDAIAQHISQSEFYVGSLVRLAAAFSSPASPVDMRHLDHVGVLAVDEHHIEIEAVVCDRSDCASVLVPVEFPHECIRDGTMETCVLENLDELNAQARAALERSQATEVGGPSSADHTNQLNSPDVLYPNWWLSAKGHPELVGECSTIRNLLNGDEEFASDIRNLVCRAMGLDVAESYLVEKGVVADLGPAGFCFKALMATSGYSTSGSGGVGGTSSIEHHVVDVSLPFAGEPRMDAGSLRAAVLNAVDGARVK